MTPNKLNERLECCGKRTVRFQGLRLNSSHSYTFGGDGFAPTLRRYANPSRILKAANAVGIGPDSLLPV